MRWIKKRDLFLSEAKIKDLILPRQAKQVKEYWGEKYLDYEEVTPTDKIVQGVWKLSEEDKNKVLSLLARVTVLKGNKRSLDFFKSRLLGCFLF
jgi:hypothetical protein